MDELLKLLGFILVIGFGGCLVVATMLAGISKAIWKTQFSWQIIIGISAALAALSMVACVLWIAYIGNRTY